MKEILEILATKAAIPAVFGWYHIFCLAVTAILTVTAIHCGKKASTKRVNNWILITSLIVIALEVYKQVICTFGNGSQPPEYLWHTFPFQFCSTPMYVGLLAGIIRKGRIHDALCSYLATYVIFAGLCVMIYPGDVYNATVGLNIQTMICHSSMIILGGYLLSSGHVKLEWKTVLRAMPVFAVCVILAAIMNEIAHANGIESFNMFFVSQYAECTLPVLSLVYHKIPAPLNLIVYILGFTLAAALVLLAAVGIRKLSRLFCRKQAL